MKNINKGRQECRQVGRVWWSLRGKWDSCLAVQAMWKTYRHHARDPRSCFQRIFPYCHPKLNKLAKGWGVYCKHMLYFFCASQRYLIFLKNIAVLEYILYDVLLDLPLIKKCPNWNINGFNSGSVAKYYSVPPTKWKYSILAYSRCTLKLASGVFSLQITVF